MGNTSHNSLFPAPNVKSSRIWAGKTIGILGGSFNPVHEGHVHISKQALANLPIDALWWSFTPGNPFKTHISMPSIDQRITQAAEQIDDPRIILTDIEAQMGVQRTHEFGKALAYYFPNTRFIWVGGMDLPEQFHHWGKWKSVIKSFPIVFFKRPPYKGTLKRIPIKILQSVKHIYHLPKAASLFKKNHIYWALQGSTLKASSSAIRGAEGKV